ncbi:hypothetical protein Rhe02_00010 [Rhizocola hellebori]|uniref:Uncharacterized protein n=1 Tax=Rhizocola hellebori TaxID=1392758 RepID=A0A8J3Q1K6_9ACTN|nr:hypothetical protein [Rhizocola hellebori]GIH01934.1 hypothetical protein Rhe02_00010 [Rhizocola hellebori]
MNAPARTSALRAVPASPIAGMRARPLPIPSVSLVGGPPAAWQQRNGEATIPHCIEQLEVSGALDNFRQLRDRNGPGGAVPADGRAQVLGGLQ